MSFDGLWVPAEPASSSTTLDDLTDVATTGATDGQALVYDAESQTWGPGDVASSTPIDDSPADGETTHAISSNWAFDHAAATTAHGISSFGATLVDDADAATARGTLGLGDAAVANVSSTPTSGATTTPISSDAAFALLMKTNLLLGGI